MIDIKAEARFLAKRNPGQMTAEEYAVVGHEIATVAPGQVVIFGAGRDSALWVKINSGGRTIFFEDEARWMPKVGEPYLVRYVNGAVSGIPDSFEQGRNASLVLVDGPKGYRPTDPGRFVSIRVAAAARALSGCVVIVHDCHRDAERSACLSHLGPADREVHHLLIWEAAPCGS